MFRFKYEDHVFEAQTEQEVFDYVIDWVDKNFDAFNDYVFNRGSTLIKDNYEDYLPDFAEDHIEEL